MSIKRYKNYPLYFKMSSSVINHGKTRENPPAPPIVGTEISRRLVLGIPGISAFVLIDTEAKDSRNHHAQGDTPTERGAAEFRGLGGCGRCRRFSWLSWFI